MIMKKFSWLRSSSASVFWLGMAIVLSLGACEGKKKKDADEILSKVKSDLKVQSHDSYVMPRPDSIFETLENTKIDFRKTVHLNEKGKYDNTVKNALNLGMRSADGIIFYYAKEKEKGVKVAETVISLVQNLRLDKKISEQIKELQVAAKKNKDSEKIREKFDNVVAYADEALKKRGDSELATLISLGGWIESTYIISKKLKEGYNKEGAMILAQPQYLDVYIDALKGGLSSLVKKYSVLATIQEQLPKMKQLMQEEAVTKAGVAKLYEITKSLKKQIEK